MLYIIIGVGILFLLLAVVLTEHNAKYLLSGYNTMTEAQREKADIKAYIPYFKKYHYFLGASFIAIGLLLYLLFGENVSGVFLLVYPIIAYIYFMWTSRRYSVQGNAKQTQLAIGVLVVTCLITLGLIWYGFQENALKVESNSIEIEGMYGEGLAIADIASVELTDTLPKISYKLNGYAMGEVNKGYFKTEDGEKVKLLLNAKNKPYILITKKSGERIFYTAKEHSSVNILKEMKKALPDIHYIGG